MNSVFEQAQQLTEIWTGFASKMAISGMSFDPDSSPPEAGRQIRSAVFQAMSQQAEQYMRTPQFIQMMKQSMDAAITFREQINDFLTRLHHDTQGVARQDIDSLMLSIRHMETRILDRMEQLSARLDTMEQRLSAPRGKVPTRAARPAAKRTPRAYSAEPPVAASATKKSIVPNAEKPQEPGATHA